MIDIEHIERLWDNYSKDDGFRRFYINCHSKGMCSYVKDVLFESISFTEKMKNNILSNLDEYIEELGENDFNNLNFPVLGNKMKDIVISECENNQFSTDKIDYVLKEMYKSFDINCDVGLTMMFRLLIILEYMYN